MIPSTRADIIPFSISLLYVIGFLFLLSMGLMRSGCIPNPVGFRNPLSSPVTGSGRGGAAEGWKRPSYPRDTPEPAGGVSSVQYRY